MDDKTVASLRAPFPPEAVGLKPKVWCRKCSSKDVQCGDHKVKLCKECRARITEAHVHLSYVGHAHVRERLIEVDPEWNWAPLAFTNTGLPALDDHDCLWINLTVGGKTMLGCGDAPGKRGGDAQKERIGDAIRNAAQSFGIALDYWKKDQPTPVAESEGVQPKAKQVTPEDRATELRGQIAAIGKRAGKDPAAVADDFAAWSRGQDIRKASVAVLAEYKDHLANGAPA